MTLGGPHLNIYRTACFWALMLFIGACSSSTPPVESQYYHHPMTAYLQSDLADGGLAEPLVHITVPLRNLVFSRQDGEIRGGLEVVVVAWEDGGQIGGAVSSEMISLPTWEAASSDSLLSLDVRVPLETASKVILEVRARSLGTTRTWTRNIEWDPDQWRRLPLVFDEWIWNAEPDGQLKTEFETLKVELVTKRVSESAGSGHDVSVELVISGRDGFELKTVESVNLGDFSGENYSHMLVVPVEELPFGRYEALAGLVCEAGLEGEFISPWYPARPLLISRINFDDDDAWELQMEWLEGLFPPEDVDLLKSVVPSQRSAHWAGLWGEDTAHPLTEESHLKNILNADQRFGGVQRGALTDQGRAWVRYGEPDHIEHKGNMTGRYRRWEIWYYRDSHMSLTFLDAHGLGEYRLIETDFTAD